MSSPPERFGEYEILEVLAVGGMAEVSVAVRRGIEGFEKIVALKKILPHLSRDPAFVEMFKSEARIAAGLLHPAIVQVYDFGRVGETYYIALEFVRGKDARDVLRFARAQGEAVPPALAAYVAMHVAEALEYAHGQPDELGRMLRTVHRDLTPSNILLSFRGEVKLTDFGVAKAAQMGEATRTGVLKGKAQYMSPEQVTGEPLDGRSDLFSLGAVLYELLTLERLFDAETEVAALDRVRHAPIRPPTELLPDLPQALEGIVLRALERDRTRRYATAGEMAAALRAFLSAEAPLVGAQALASYLETVFPVEAAERDTASFLRRLAAGRQARSENAGTAVLSGARDPRDAGAAAGRRRRWRIGAAATAALVLGGFAAWERIAPPPAPALTGPPRATAPPATARQAAATESEGDPAATSSPTGPEIAGAEAAPAPRRPARRRRTPTQEPPAAETVESEAQPPAALPRTAKGRGGSLRIVAESYACTFFVDEVPVASGRSFVLVSDLPLGPHRFRVESASFPAPRKMLVELTRERRHLVAELRGDEWIVRAGP